MIGALGWAAMAEAGDRRPVEPPVLASEHTHPSKAFTFRVPEGWTVGPVEGNPQVLQATDGTLGVRFLHYGSEAGFESLHIACMQERIGSAMEAAPRLRYEYDFVWGHLGERRILDSAFVVTYDRPQRGHRAWRQRNLTVAGGGQSLCVMADAPAEAWKKSTASRAALEAIVGSVAFR